ncbi:MAG TPA: chloride channel protein, partial [Flavobacteriaceae bacterium]|nr:chloride channel protein [Flavobacteriaceae bacterium]
VLHLNQATRTLMIGCAAAGAMSSIFKAPIAAIIFAVEVFSLDLTLMSLVPLLLASVTAIITSYFFFGNDILLPFTVVDAFSISDIPFYLILALVAGLVSIYFTNTYEWIQKRFDTIPNKWHRMLLGGTLIGVLVYCIPPLYGEGFDVINNLVQGNANLALENNLFNVSTESIYVTLGLLIGLVVFKIIASALTFGAGGVGGIFAPTLFMGSIMGYTVALILRTVGVDSANISISNFTLVGMAGLMAGVLHAPLTAIFLIAELTGGYALFIPLMITSAVAYSITKYVHPHSVYTMELGRKGELITHNKDHAVLTLMDLDSVVEQNFIAINPDMSLGEIVTHCIIKSNRNIFPVVTPDSGQLLGIILLDDLRPVMFERQLYLEITARDLMQNPLGVVELDKDRMTDVMKKFQDTGAWNLPVVRSGAYHGFVSKSKLLTVYRRKLIDFSGAT